MAPKQPQYRELRSPEAESLRSLAPLRDSGLARRGAARSSAADPGRFASPAALLELRGNTWRGAADVEDAGIHGMPFKYAERRENPLECEGIALQTRENTCDYVGSLSNPGGNACPQLFRHVKTRVII